MAFRNEWEILDLVAKASSSSVARYAKYLLDWMEIVNSNSDGWPYWKAGSDAGNKLADLIAKALRGEEVPAATFNRAIGGIKRTVSNQKKRYGNTIPVPTLSEEESF